MLLINIGLIVFFISVKEKALFKLLSYKYETRKEYLLEPPEAPNMYLDTNTEYLQPYIPLVSSSYVLTRIEDQIKSRAHKSNDLIMANKRIMELGKWGKGMMIKKNVNTAEELISWWTQEEPPWWDFSKSEKYNSWEANLAQYLLSINNQIKIYRINAPLSLSEISSLLKLKLFVQTFNKQIEYIVYNGTTSLNDRTYLLNLSKKVDGYLNTKIDLLYEEGNVNSVRYPLSQLQKDHQSGIYDVYIDTSSFPSDYIKKLNVAIDNRQMKLDINNESNFISVKNLTLDQSVKDIYIRIPNAISGKNLKSITPIQENGIYKYYFEIKGIDLNNKYHLKINYKSNDVLVAQIEQINKKVTLQTSSAIYSEYLLPHSTNVEGTIHFKNSPFVIMNRLVLLAQKPLTDEEISQLNFELIPIYKPALYLKKISPLPNKNVTIGFTNNKHSQIIIHNYNDEVLNNLKSMLGFGWSIRSTTYKDNAILEVQYWLGKIIIQVTMLLTFSYLFYLLNLSRKIMSKTKPIAVSLGKSMRRATSILQLVIQYFGFIFFFVLVTSVFLHLFIIPYPMDAISILILISLLGFLYSFKVNVIVPSAFAIALLSFMTLLVIFSQSQLAEKVASLIYLDLIIIIVYLITSKSYVDDKHDTKTHIKQSIRENKLIKFLKSLLIVDY